MDVLKGPRKQEVRIFDGKPHLCTTIGGIIVKDLGEYNTQTRKICGSPIYTENQLMDKYQSIEEKIKDGLDKEERERLLIMRQKEEKRKQKEFEERIIRESEELDIRAKRAVVKKLERQAGFGDEDIVEIPLRYKAEDKVEEKVEDKIEPVIIYREDKKDKIDNKRVITAVDTSKTEEKMEVKTEFPKITVTTNTGTLGGKMSSSGTGTIYSGVSNIVSVPKVKENVEEKVDKKVEEKVDKKENEKETKNKSMIDEYMDILYLND